MYYKLLKLISIQFFRILGSHEKAKMILITSSGLNPMTIDTGLKNEISGIWLLLKILYFLLNSSSSSFYSSSSSYMKKLKQSV